MRKISLLSLATLVLLQSCGGGVTSRTVGSLESDEESNLTAEQIEVLANAKIIKDLEALEIGKLYSDAKAKFPGNNFKALEDLSAIKCADSNYNATLTKYKSYGAIVGKVNIKLNDLLDKYSDDHQQKDLSTDDLRVLLSAIEKTEDYGKTISALSLKCQSVKKINVDEDELAPVDKTPIGPPAEDK